jgi:hypothetical protein
MFRPSIPPTKRVPPRGFEGIILSEKDEYPAEEGLHRTEERFFQRKVLPTSGPSPSSSECLAERRLADGRLLPKKAGCSVEEGLRRFADCRPLSCGDGVRFRRPCRRHSSSKRRGCFRRKEVVPSDSSPPVIPFLANATSVRRETLSRLTSPFLRGLGPFAPPLSTLLLEKDLRQRCFRGRRGCRMTPHHRSSPSLPTLCLLSSPFLQGRGPFAPPLLTLLLEKDPRQRCFRGKRRSSGHWKPRVRWRWYARKSSTGKEKRKEEAALPR